MGVVARLDGRVEHLFEGMPARFAGLELNQVEDLLAAFDQQIVEAQEDVGALGRR